MVDPELYLLRGPMPELSKMSKKELMEECQMWRNVWSWVPSEVKYYVARTGQQIGITLRNYKRYLGVLLDTHWELTEIELGVYDKVYDTVTGEQYYERKIVKCKLGGIIDIQWIKDRKPEREVLAETEEMEIEQPPHKQPLEAVGKSEKRQPL